MADDERNDFSLLDPSTDPQEFLEQEIKREQLSRLRPAIHRGRTTPIAVRLDEVTLRRLKALAALRNTGYQTLLKEFVVERLYEEEKREGIISS
jgi:predicted DNA binding CopG/RHH family protein